MNIEMFIYIGIVIYSIILHELAHGYAALICGDTTAKRAGRLSLNPVPHLDPIGSVVLPIMAVLSGFGVFGWAKPVPIDPSYLTTKIKEIFVSGAGIATNFALCLIFLFLIKLNIGVVYHDLFLKVAIVNLGLGLFNLLPFPPFDGLQILRAIFPRLKYFAHDLEYNPASMIVSILIAGYVFNLFFSDVVNFVFGLVLG
jgi:Zn-dependent protease